MSTGHLDTTKYTEMVGNAASQVKISSTKFKAFVGDVKEKNDSNYDLLDVNNENAIGMKRQALINGNFDVWQRGTSWTNPASGTYTADRWNVQSGTDGGTLPNIVHSRQSLLPNDIPGSFYFYRMSSDGAGTSLGVNSSYLIRQKIEFGTRYLCGAGKKITVSVWIKSSIANKKAAVRIVQNYGTGGSPSSTETIVGSIVTLTSGWVKYSFTITTNTLAGKTFGTNNDDSLYVDIFTMWGSTQASAFGSSTAENFVGVGNIDIAQVQVNAGDQALPFQPRSFGEELALCKRYFQKSFPYTTAPAQAAGRAGVFEIMLPNNSATGTWSGWVILPVMMRTTPTITFYNPDAANGLMRNLNKNIDVLTVTSDRKTENSFNILVSNPSGATTWAIGGDFMGVHYTLDSEI